MEALNSNCKRIILFPETQNLYKLLLNTITNISQDTASLLFQKFQFIIISSFQGAEGQLMSHYRVSPIFLKERNL